MKWFKNISLKISVNNILLSKPKYITIKVVEKGLLDYGKYWQ